MYQFVVYEQDYIILNTQYEREITGDEKKVIELFMVNDLPDFKKEYDYIWCSSKKKNEINILSINREQM